MTKEKKQGIPSSGSRRDFLKTLSTVLLTPLVVGEKCSDDKPKEPDPTPQVYGPRTGRSNPFLSASGKPLLICVEGTDFTQMLQTGLETLGGLVRLVDNNQDVLIKPNLVEPSHYPYVSDVNSVAALVQEVSNVTSGAVQVGDMGYYPSSEVYEHLNIASSVENAGGTLVTFSETYKVRRDSWPGSKPDFNVFSQVYNAPIVINFPNLKRHEVAFLTCAIKCFMGTMNGPQTTSTREYIHYTAPDFLVEMAELPGLIKPELNIVDARTILTVDGPLEEHGGVFVNLNKIILCGDIVATDTYCAQLMEDNDSTFSASFIDTTLSHAVSLGLGTTDLSQLEIVEVTA